MIDIYVYDLEYRTFRELSTSSGNGILFFKRQAIELFAQYYLICGLFIFGNNGILYYFDIQADKIIIEEQIFLKLFKYHINDLKIYNIKQEPKGNIFSTSYLCLIKKLIYKENPNIEEPFLALCDMIVDNPKTQYNFFKNGESLLLPTTYSELCKFAQILLTITNFDYLNEDYAKNFKYLIDALINNYHINMDYHDIESTAYKIINLSIKALEE